jgi:hypothetical protein
MLGNAGGGIIYSDEYRGLDWFSENRNFASQGVARV